MGTKVFAAGIRWSEQRLRSNYFKKNVPRDLLPTHLFELQFDIPCSNCSFVKGPSATVPFITKASRDLNLDINILLANIDILQKHALHELLRPLR